MPPGHAKSDYLRPVSGDRGEAAVSRQGTATEPLQDFWAPTRRGLVRIPFGTIERFIAEGDYVRVHTADRSYLLRSTLSNVELRLCERSFVRVHRSAIVALSDVAGLRHRGSGAWSIVHRNETTSTIGRRYLAGVRARLGVDWMVR